MDNNELRYPILLFRDGYIFRADNGNELLLHDKRTFDETIRGDWRVIDSVGALFHVVEWERIPRPRGLKAFSQVLLGGIYAQPKLVSERKLTIQEFIHEIEPMLLRYRMYGNRYGDDEERFRNALKSKKTFSELYEFLESAV